MTVPSELVRFEELYGICIIRFEVQRIDHETFDAVYKSVVGYIDASEPERVLANLRRVEYLHSVGIGLLTALIKHVNAYGGKLRLCSMQPEVHELLTITSMHNYFDIYDTEKAAIADF